jgi:hypothetical protein
MQWWDWTIDKIKENIEIFQTFIPKKNINKTSWKMFFIKSKLKICYYKMVKLHVLFLLKNKNFRNSKRK